MLNEQLKIRGKAIVDELELGVEQTTEKWMAHYLAELMERAEKGETLELRQQASNQSANIILTLWEQKKQKARYEYYSELNKALSEVYEKRPFAEALQSVLDDPEQIDDMDAFSERLSILFYIDFYETDLLRLYLIADVVAKIQNNEVAEEVVRDFENAEDAFISAKDHVQDIWPDIEQISLNQVSQLQNFITAKLKDFHQIRERLLSRMQE